MGNASLRNKIRRVWQFVSDDIWDIELTSLSALRALGVRLLRIIHLVVRGFREDKCPLHASALTYSTLMAIVPILAFSLALARGLGDETRTRDRIREAVSQWTSTFREAPGPAPVPDQVEPLTPAATEARLELADEIDNLVEQALQKVDNVNFTALGSVGLVLLFGLIIQVLGQVEDSFNNVWGVTACRPVWRKFTDYLSVLVVLPILAVAASSLPIVDFATRFLDEATANLVRSFLLSGFLRELVVLLMTTVTFGFILMFMPNTRVKPVPALVGGLVTGLLFIVWLKLCAALQIGVGRAGAIYGSFATVPILLAWVYTSWQIILFGAEITFAVQNGGTYRMEQGARRANIEARMQLALTILAEAGRATLGEAPPFAIAAFARERRISVRFLNDVVEDLVTAGLMAEIAHHEGHFALLRAPTALGIHDVLKAVSALGVKPSALGLVRLDPGVEEALRKIASGLNTTLRDVTVQTLLGGMGPVKRPVPR